MSSSRSENQRLLDNVESFTQSNLTEVIVEASAVSDRNRAVVMGGYFIPKDVLLVIASHLNVYDIAALSATNYSLHQVVNSPSWSNALYVNIPDAPENLHFSLTDARHYLVNGYPEQRILARWDKMSGVCNRTSNCADIEFCSLTTVAGMLVGSFAAGVSVAGYAVLGPDDLLLGWEVSELLGFVFCVVAAGAGAGSLGLSGIFCCVHKVTGKCAECSRAKHDSEELRQKNDPQLSKGYWANRFFKNNLNTLGQASLYLRVPAKSEELPPRINMHV